MKEVTDKLENLTKDKLENLTKRQLQALRTKNKIYQAAVQEINEKGFEEYIK